MKKQGKTLWQVFIEEENAHSSKKRNQYAMATKYHNWDEATHDVPRFHLTLCGYEAGRPLCDCDKQAELRDGCLFFHAVYAPEPVFNDPRLCPKCKVMWDESD